MTRVRLELRGGAALRKALKAQPERTEAEVAKAIDATGLELRGDIVKRYQRGPASGRVYQKYNPRRVHVASAPGQAPATDTGRLAGSVTYERDTPLSAAVGSVLAYAAMLEFGTSRIAQRPAWVPAVEAMRGKFQKRLERALRRSQA